MCRSLSPSPATARSSLAPPHLFNSQSRTRSPQTRQQCARARHALGRVGGHRGMGLGQAPPVGEAPAIGDLTLSKSVRHPRHTSPGERGCTQAPARRPCCSRRATINHAIAVLRTCSALLLLLIPSSPLPTCPVVGILSDVSRFRELKKPSRSKADDAWRAKGKSVNCQL
jgi:hypothetical protein